MCKAYLSMWRGVSFYRLCPCINLLLIPLMWCIYEISVMSGSFSVATTNRLLLGVTIDISNKCWSLAIYSSINASNECCFYFYFYFFGETMNAASRRCSSTLDDIFCTYQYISNSIKIQHCLCGIVPSYLDD